MKYWTLLLVLVSLVCLSGCSVFAPVKEGQDPIVVNAERTIKTSFETCNTFVAWERINSKLVKEKLPSVHAFANQVRIQSQAAFDGAWEALDVYQLTKSDETKSKLDRSLGLISDLARRAREALQNGQKETGVK